MRCFQGQHWLYAVLGFVLFVLFVGTSARLVRVGGELGNIEMQLHNPLDWRGDCGKRMPYKHRLSAANIEHASGTVAVKTVAVLAATYLGTQHPVVVAAVRSSSS
jgi:hypothetical protein